MGRDELRRRYLSLGLGEFVAVVVFLGAYWYLRPRFGDDTRLLEAALAMLVFLLVQGGCYWLLARRWIPDGAMPSGLAATFRGLRVLDAVLLVVTAALAGWWAAPEPSLVLATLVWLFAVAEYVNYFWVRLSYPPLEWWRGVRTLRRSRLRADLDRASAARNPGAGG